MKRRDLIKHLESQGCSMLREGSRHSWWHHPCKKRRSAVPRHREVNDILVLKICRDLDIDRP